MKKIRLYRHPECPKCAQYARIHHKLDWFNQLEDTTETPPSGPLRLGEIVLENIPTRKIYRGVECIRMLCKHILLYWLILPFTYIPAFKKAIEKEAAGCSDTSCQT